MVPALHPILRTFVGAPSHLLWFVLVVPVGASAYGRSQRWAIPLAALAALWTAVGEFWFGAGYGHAADPATILALTTAVGLVAALTAVMARGLRTLEERHEAEARFAMAAIESATLATLLLSTTGALRHANPAARELLELTAPGSPARRDITDAVPELLQSLDGSERRLSLTIAPVLGRSRPLLVEVSPIFAKGKIHGYHVGLQDESDSLRRAAAERRAATLQELGMVLAGVAHEISTPLTSVELLARELRTAVDSSPGPVVELTDQLVAEARRARGVAQQLLERVRGQAGPATAVDLSAIVTDLVATRHRLSTAHGVHLRVNLPTGTAIEAIGHRVEIEQIVSNLLANAEQAMHQANREGEVEVTVRRTPAIPMVEILVDDEGPGVPAGVQGRLFEPFFSTKGEAGNGIGLSLARRLAVGMGGDLTHEASPRGGARFILRLPLRTEVETPPTDMIPTHHGSRGSLLVVDDEPVLRRAVARAGERLGFACSTAATVAEAMQLVGGLMPATIISDRHLADEDGLELLSAIRRELPSSRLILMTGEVPGAASLERLRELRATLLMKPFQLAEIGIALGGSANDDDRHTVAHL
ncbi:MAG: response regulator [Gemmatimonadetes bacterium]|nr:response regulator [Gemmatimonadota bacterium]